MSEKIKEFLIEEIFGSVAKDDHIELPNGASLREIIDEDLPEMLGEYAEQMAIGFAAWIGQNRNYILTGDKKTWLDNREYFAYTTKELYQLYLKSIEK